jgi:uncharacterized membrane protein
MQMKLDKKLIIWREQQLISTEQYSAILKYEARHQTNSHWFLYGFILLGAAVMGIGLISIIAANWADIPVWLKLGVDFSLLLSLGFGIQYFYTRSTASIWTEVFLFSFQLLCLASIALLSQVYHSGGMWYHALLLWSIITFPINLYAKHYLSHVIWVSLFLLSSVWSLIEFLYLILDIHANDWNIEIKLAAVLLTTPLLSISLSYIAAHYRYTPLAITLRMWFIISLFSCLLFADIIYWSSNWVNIQSGLFIPAYLFSFLLLGLILFKMPYCRLSKAVLLLALALLLLLYHPNFLTTLIDSQFIAPFLIISILLLYALHLGLSEQQALFNAVTFLIGLRFLVIYFEVLGSLAETGVGLMLSGLLIISVSYAWYRARQPLQNWIRGFK